MKKLGVLFSLFLLVALVMAACGPANNNAQQTPGVVETPVDPGVDPTVDPGVVDPTPTLEVIDEATPTVEDTPVMEETPVAEATAEGEVPVTGVDDVDLDDMCFPNRLTNLLDYDVRDQAGNRIGEVEAVVVFRGAFAPAIVPVAPVDEGETTGDAGALDLTPTPGVVDNDTQVDPNVQLGEFQQGANPVLAYLLVDLNDLDVYAEVSGEQATGDDAVLDLTPTPDVAPGPGDEAGDNMDRFRDREVMIPFGAFQAVQPGTPLGDDDDDCALTLTIDRETLLNAPEFDENVWADGFIPGWDSSYTAYWSEQGMTVPSTSVEGEAALYGQPVVFRTGLTSFDVDVRNAQDESLGEVVDFIIDPQSGDFEYAVLQRGGVLGLGARFYPVPMDQVMWYPDVDRLDVEHEGVMIINVPEEHFENAPAFESLDDLDRAHLEGGWQTEFDAYWRTQ
jgi:hypothetical protein